MDKIEGFVFGTSQYLHQQSAELTVLPLDHKNLTGKLVYSCPNNTFLKCKVEYKLYEPLSIEEHFVLIAGYRQTGALGQSRYPVWQEFCGLVKCTDWKCKHFATESKAKFKSVRLEGIFNSGYIYSGVMTSGLQLLPTANWSTFSGELYRYRKTIQVDLNINATKPESLLHVTFYGRNYDADAEYKH